MGHTAVVTTRNLSSPDLRAQQSGYTICFSPMGGPKKGPTGVSLSLLSSALLISVSSLLPGTFSDPLQFKPERWLRGCPQHHKAHPFAYISFGHGPRKCIGMRFAELEMLIITIKILQFYKLEYHHQPVGLHTDFIKKPDKKIKLKLIKR